MLPSATVLAALRLEQEHRRRPSKFLAIIADPVFSSRDERVKTVHAPINSGIKAALSFAFPLEIDQHADNVPEPGSGRRDSHQLRRLIFSREEAKSISALVPGEQLMVELDFGASLATATSRRLGQYRIVHFSTHGVLDSAHPELSGLILSLVDEHGQNQKGFLGYQEIYNLRLPADLVVLSGCDTALGKEIWGEGLVGLTRGFMYAGAARVLASLWEVDDYATAELMRLFYQGLKSNQMRPAAALRAAQLKMLEDVRWRSPYFWASFELQGEWK
jgi:CHAT domain-containing protein